MEDATSTSEKTTEDITFEEQKKQIEQESKAKIEQLFNGNTRYPYLSFHLINKNSLICGGLNIIELPSKKGTYGLIIQGVNINTENYISKPNEIYQFLEEKEIRLDKENFARDRLYRYPYLYDKTLSINIPKILGIKGTHQITFEYLKSVFRKLRMRGYSSKSKEQLIDEILERITLDASNYDTRNDYAMQVISSEDRYRNSSRVDEYSGKEGEVVDDYEKAIGIVTRISGGFYFPYREPMPTLDILNKHYVIGMPADISIGAQIDEE